MDSRGSKFNWNQLKSMLFLYIFMLNWWTPGARNSTKIDVFCTCLCLLDGLPRLETQLKSIKIDVFCICLCLLDGLPRLEIQLKSCQIVVFCMLFMLIWWKMNEMNENILKWMKIHEFYHIFMQIVNWLPGKPKCSQRVCARFAQAKLQTAKRPRKIDENCNIRWNSMKSKIWKYIF